MSQALLLKPDSKFVEDIVKSGGGDLKKCYQCATCSVVCELSTETAPFPRKEMIWAQWGLRDRLITDPDIWRCHQCNDCSIRCPRGARPGDVLAAVRQKSIEHHAFPNFLARAVNQVKFYPLLLVMVPALLLTLALVLRGPVEAILPFEEHGDAFYAGFFPHWLLIGFYSSFTTISFLGLLVGLARFWRGMAASDKEQGREPVLGVIPSVIRIVTSTLVHDRFAKCTDKAGRRLSHLMAFYGFNVLFIVTVWATIDIYLMPLLGVDSLYPFDLVHPMKILGNVGGVLLIAGAILALRDRLADSSESGFSTSFDWTFVWLLLLVGITGFATEVFRFIVDPAQRTALEYAAYTFYFVHLVMVFSLLVYLPYSKFAHIFYRTVALVYAEHTGRTQEAGRAELEAAPQPKMISSS
jgi:quinone-modifying oxidoreductase subunit QmoC